MKINIELEIEPNEVELTTELLNVLRCVSCLLASVHKVDDVQNV